MIKTLSVFAAVFCLAAPLSGQEVKVESYMLDNGMEFLLVPRKEQPHSLVCGWAARVGSVNERPGITGISHFFEHMMFKGTDKIGTRDPAKDREFRERQEEVRSKLRDLHLNTQFERVRRGEIADPWDPKNDTPEMAKLRAELKQLMVDQGKLSVKNELATIYKSAGGSGLNAFTSNDMTVYHVQLPANKFELWAWLESDRLYAPSFREFYEERDVVHEERRLRTESTPTGIYEEMFDALFWQSSSYHWPVIGWPDDLNSYTRAQAESYYQTYYAPNNLVGVIVGDFDPAIVKETVRKYFSRLERRAPPPPIVTREMPQLAEQMIHAECDCPPEVTARYHTVPFLNPDEDALDILAEILNGRTGRLYKGLVLGREIASEVRTRQVSRKYGGYFVFSAECKGDATPEGLLNAWEDELSALQTEPVGERELQKVKNRVVAEAYRGMQENFSLFRLLATNEAMGAWETVNESPKRLQKITAEDVMEVANKYFDRSNRAEITYSRKEKTEKTAKTEETGNTQKSESAARKAKSGGDAK